MKTYNYILLDWDGNLVRTNEVWLDAIRQATEKRGLNLSDEELSSAFGAISQKLESWGISDLDDALNEITNVAIERIPEADLYPNVLQLLEYLRDKGKRVALVTTSSKQEIRHLLQKFSIRSLFSVIITREDVTHRKPHPEPLEKALVLLKANKQEAIMIGDSDKDLGAANNTGIDSVLFYPPEHKKFYDLEKLKSLNPTYVVSDFRKIVNIIS